MRMMTGSTGVHATEKSVTASLVGSMVVAMKNPKLLNPGVEASGGEENTITK
jgi:hypothetical protein